MVTMKVVGRRARSERATAAHVLLRTKQTLRPKDVPDRLYLERLLAG